MKTRYLFLIACSLIISSNLLAQPVEDSTVTKLTPIERLNFLHSALQTPSIIKDTAGKYEITLDDSWVWWNNSGSYNNEIYFNVFHHTQGKQDGEILNRYCGDLTDAKETYFVRRVGIQLAGDNTDMQELCGNLTVDGATTKVQVEVIKLPSGLKNDDEIYTVEVLNELGYKVPFDVKIKRQDDYQGYYELYSADKKHKLVFYGSDDKYQDRFSSPMSSSTYMDYVLGAGSYLHALDKDGYLESYGMNFNHLGNADPYSRYCASYQNIKDDGSAQEQAKVVFYIAGEEDAAKCAGVADKDLVKIKMDDPGTDGKEYKRLFRYDNTTFNITFKGTQESLERP